MNKLASHAKVIASIAFDPRFSFRHNVSIEPSTIYEGMKFLRDTSDEVRLIWPDGSEESYLEAMSYHRPDTPQVSYFDSRAAEKVLADYIKTSLPELAEPYSVSYFGVSFSVNTSSYARFLVEKAREFPQHSLFVISYYLNRFLEVHRTHSLSIKTCRLIYVDGRIHDEIGFDGSVELVPFEKFRYRNRGLDAVINQRNDGVSWFALDVHRCYVVVGSETRSFSELDSLAPNDTAVAPGSALFDEHFQLLRRLQNVKWALALSTNNAVDEIGSFVLIESAPMDFHPFLFSLKGGKPYRNASDVETSELLQVYGLLNSYDRDYWNRIQICLQRFLQASNASNEVDKAIDLRVALELVFDLPRNNKRREFGRRASKLLSERARPEYESIYSSLSEAIHRGKLEGIEDATKLISDSVSILKMTVLKLLEMNRLLTNDDWPSFLER